MNIKTRVEMFISEALDIIAVCESGLPISHKMDLAYRMSEDFSEQLGDWGADLPEICSEKDELVALEEAIKELVPTYMELLTQLSAQKICDEGTSEAL